MTHVTHQPRTAYLSWIIDCMKDGNLSAFDSAVKTLRERIEKGERMDLDGFTITRPEGYRVSVLINKKGLSNHDAQC